MNSFHRETKPLPPSDNRVFVRRKRRPRLFVQDTADEKGEKIENTYFQLSPSISFFFFSFVCACLACLGYAYNLPPLLFLSIVLSPFMAPFLGICFSTVTGSFLFLINSLFSSLFGCVIVFGTSALLSWQFNLATNPTGEILIVFTQFSWVNILILVFGVFCSVYFTVTNRDKYARLFNTTVVMEIYLPIAATGIGFISGKAEIFPSGLYVVGIHIVIALILGSLTFIFLGIRSSSTGKILFSILIIGLLILIGGGLDYLRPKNIRQNPTATRVSVIVKSPAIKNIQKTNTLTPSLSPSPSASPTVTRTMVDLSIPSPAATSPDQIVVILTPTPAATLSLSIPTNNGFFDNQTLVASLTITPKPTPVWAVINSSEGGGAVIRSEPRFTSKYLRSILNGSIIEILNEKVMIDNYLWVHVRTPDGLDGWMLRSLLVTATPPP